MTNMKSPPLQPMETPRNDGLSITETTVTIRDATYRVRRVSDPATGSGFAMIYDPAGKNILVYSAKFPAEHDAQLIIGWRTGHQLGLEQRDGGVS